MAEEQKKEEIKPKEVKVEEEKKISTFKKVIAWMTGVLIVILISGTIMIGVANGTLSAKAVLITITILLLLAGTGIWFWVWWKKKFDMQEVVKELSNEEARMQAGFDIEEDFGQDKPRIIKPMQPVPLAKKTEKFKFNFLIFELEYGEKRAYLINRLNQKQKAYVDVSDATTELQELHLIITRAEQLADIEKRQKIVRKTDSAGNIVEEIVDAEIVEEKRFVPFEG